MLGNPNSIPSESCRDIALQAVVASLNLFLDIASKPEVQALPTKGIDAAAFAFLCIMDLSSGSC
jgi:hypothetical protein